MIPTREAALERLNEFLPRAGAAYARDRNFDHGPDDRSNISMLSPYLRHRLITEEEVTLAVLTEHGARRAEKFLQEVAWRTYWKGWLEMRPGLWNAFLDALPELPRNEAYQQAVTGRSGLDCFDAWARELNETGYLHNHTRMWFASIWIFTLKLPWQLGAEFFMRHLMDADPASNTLSWRWVAGLHTPGKHYLARASNITKFTGGRFNPAGELNESATPLPPDGEFERQPLTLEPDPATGEKRVGHLLTPDDLSSAPGELGPVSSRAVIGEASDHSGEAARRFLVGALKDVADRSEARLLEGDPAQAIRSWIDDEKLDLVVVSQPTVGPWHELTAHPNLPIQFFTRNWDRTLWPKATAGFFKLKKSLPLLHEAMQSRTQSLRSPL
ncbi:MAG: FAD-binding domain-containing protein [Verrucomicrobiota bacterium]